MLAAGVEYMWAVALSCEGMKDDAEGGAMPQLAVSTSTGLPLPVG